MIDMTLRDKQRANEAGIQMRCPKCGHPMEESILYVNRYRCFNECNAAWITIEWDDAGGPTPTV